MARRGEFVSIWDTDTSNVSRCQRGRQTATTAQKTTTSTATMTTTMTARNDRKLERPGERQKQNNIAQQTDKIVNNDLSRTRVQYAANANVYMNMDRKQTDDTIHKNFKISLVDDDGDKHVDSTCGINTPHIRCMCVFLCWPKCTTHTYTHTNTHTHTVENIYSYLALVMWATKFISKVSFAVECVSVCVVQPPSRSATLWARTRLSEEYQ